MKKLAVVAFGGNALLRAGQKGTIDEQEANAYEASRKLLKLMKKKYNLVRSVNPALHYCFAICTS